jgi:hypothetical protein
MMMQFWCHLIGSLFPPLYTKAQFRCVSYQGVDFLALKLVNLGAGVWVRGTVQCLSANTEHRILFTTELQYQIYCAPLVPATGYRTSVVYSTYQYIH